MKYEADPLTSSFRVLIEQLRVAALNEPFSGNIHGVRGESRQHSNDISMSGR